MKRWLLLLGLICSGSLSASAAGPLTLEDFAWGMELQADAASPIYQLSLPLVVYRGVAQADLADLRLFNGQGHLLPHVLQAPPRRTPGESRRQGVAIFPLYGSRAADLQQLSLQLVHREADGEIRLEQRQYQQTRDQLLRGYLLRLPQLAEGERLERLQLEWGSDQGGFMQTIRVEQSRDLLQWHTLAQKRVIADLQFAGERLVEAELPLAAGLSRYIRLQPLTDEAMVTLERVLAVIRGPAASTDPQVAGVLNLRRGEVAGEYLFELPGPLPVTAVTIQPAEVNTLARASLYSRQGDQSAWRLRSQGMLYRLQQQAQEIRRQQLDTDRTRDRYWRLVVDAEGGGLGVGLPAVEVSWQPHRLRFAARGDAPYMLAYGSGSVMTLPKTALLEGFSEQQQQQLVSGAITPGPVTELAGLRALDPQRPHDWKQWLLWGVLLLATLLLGWMAWTTLRQMAA